MYSMMLIVMLYLDHNFPASDDKRTHTIDTRVFLDFGKGFGRRAKFFEEYINPRVANGIEDFLTMGLLPDVKGLYRDDLIKMAECDILEPDIDAVLLSHLDNSL
jgi:ribonuclease J